MSLREVRICVECGSHTVERRDGYDGFCTLRGVGMDPDVKACMKATSRSLGDYNEACEEYRSRALAGAREAQAEADEWRSRAVKHLEAS